MVRILFQLVVVVIVPAVSAAMMISVARPRSPFVTGFFVVSVPRSASRPSSLPVMRVVPFSVPITVPMPISILANSRLSVMAFAIATGVSRRVISVVILIVVVGRRRGVLVVDHVLFALLEVVRNFLLDVDGNARKPGVEPFQFGQKLLDHLAHSHLFAAACFYVNDLREIKRRVKY